MTATRSKLDRVSKRFGGLQAVRDLSFVHAARARSSA